MGSVEDERCFSTLAFMKSKLHNRLTTHLPLVVRMFAQWFYTLQNFSYVECIEQWRASQHGYCYDGSGGLYFVALLALFLQRQELLPMFLQRQILFGPWCAFLFVEFNGCFTSQQNFWTPITLVSLLA